MMTSYAISSIDLQGYMFARSGEYLTLRLRSSSFKALLRQVQYIVTPIYRNSFNKTFINELG